MEGRDKVMSRMQKVDVTGCRSGPADTRSRSVSPGESGSLTELCWAADANAETPQPRADGLALSFFQPNYRIDDEES